LFILFYFHLFHLFIHYYVSSIIIVHPCTHGKIFLHIMIYLMPCVKKIFFQYSFDVSKIFQKDSVLLTYSCSCSCSHIHQIASLNCLWFFDWNWNQTDTYFGSIYGILATFRHYMAPTSPYKKVLAIPKLHKTQLKVKMKVMVEILPPFFDIHNNMNMKPMTIHLESHGTSKCIFSLKKSNNYMTRFPTCHSRNGK
jgi:hypothetical protein